MDREFIWDKPHDFSKTRGGETKIVNVTAEKLGDSPKTGMEAYDYSFVMVEVKKGGLSRKVRMFSKAIDMTNTAKSDREQRVTPDIVLERYTKLKELGLPVPPTLRMSEDNKFILMTDMTDNGRFEIYDRTNCGLDASVSNWDEIIKEVDRIETIAISNGVVLAGDADALVVDKQTRQAKVVLLDIGSGVYSEERINQKYEESGKGMVRDDFVRSLSTEGKKLFIGSLAVWLR